jgi:hypothetical protein
MKDERDALAAPRLPQAAPALRSEQRPRLGSLLGHRPAWGVRRRGSAAYWELKRETYSIETAKTRSICALFIGFKLLIEVLGVIR